MASSPRLQPQMERIARSRYDDKSDTSEEESLPKDETEEQLERLLFGDSEGFHDALKGHKSTSTDLILRDDSDAEGQDKRTGEDDDNESVDYFAELDDADVSSPITSQAGVCFGVLKSSNLFPAVVIHSRYRVRGSSTSIGAVV